MEIEGAKAVIFGIGGAGCKILGQLTGESLNNCELIALDTDKGLLNSLDESIKKVVVGESMASQCGNFDEIRNALSSDINKVESSLEGANMVIIIAGLGGKTGTCIGKFIVDLCSKKEVFTLFVPIYPLTKFGVDGVDAMIKQLKNKVDGVIVVDNNLKKEGENLPMLKVFERVNEMVIELVSLLVASISNLGVMNLNKDELEHFFYGDLFFVLAEGKSFQATGANDAALKELLGYVDVEDVKRILALVSSPSEISIEDMKNLNSTMQEKLDPEGIKWVNVCTDSRDIHMLLVTAVDELPLVEGVELPEQIKPEIEKPNEEKKEPSLGSLDINIPEPGDTLEENPTFLRSQALIGLVERPAKEEPKPPPKPPTLVEEITNEYTHPKEVEEEDDEEYDIDDIVGDLTGFPSFKKKGQKKLGDYKDDLGIGYI
jgi:cell division GTPase FtsZ